MQNLTLFPATLSILSYLPGCVVFYFFQDEKQHTVYSLKKEDLQSKLEYINSLSADSDKRFCNPSENLILILFESLESWVLEKDIQGVNVAPNLRHFLRNSHVLYCDKIKSQIKHGSSGDGQMIVNTGLLPLLDDVACVYYGNNVYPNFAHFFPNSFVVNPCPHVWNQDVMSVSYSYIGQYTPTKKN